MGGQSRQTRPGARAHARGGDASVASESVPRNGWGKGGLEEQHNYSVLPFPQVATLTGWRLGLYDKVVLCAQDKEPMEVMQWLQSVEHKDCACEGLSCSRCASDYITLDRKLALALAGIVTGALKRSLAVKKEAFAAQGK